MRVLVACEFSGVVREAFRVRGHEAYSCDVLEADDDSPFHLQQDIQTPGLLGPQWDLMIAHPPCTHLAVSGARWFKDKQADGRQQAGIDFFLALAAADVPKIAIENPIGIMSRHFRRPDQVIHPFQFGHEVQKGTCLWLKGLPLLTPTNIVDRGIIYVDPRGNKHGGEFTNRAKRGYSSLMLQRNADRWKIRSRTFEGIAAAMAEQWGG